jgi:ABC-2 type transport system ATP-binding protein
MAQDRRAFLLSIHQLAVAQRACSRFLLLAEGRLLAQGTLGELQTVAGTQATSLEEIFLALT